MAEIVRDTLVDGRYRVVSRLGTGGMADVFLVEDQQLGRKVALKLLHRRFAEDPAFVERFRREAQAAAGLQHQNIVGVYDRGEYDDTYYIAMEYSSGRTLKQLIRDEAPLDPVRAIDIAIQILRAARFAHRQGIVHRDLKPHNVIVDDAGQAKVTDFGIARAGASDMTETGSIMGTAQYLSPEQAQGHSVTASSDLYSVGVVLYEMLTGRVPFDGEAAVTIALKHVSEAPVPPREFNPAIPPELEQTVLWTMNKHASDRPRRCRPADHRARALPRGDRRRRRGPAHRLDGRGGRRGGRGDARGSRPPTARAAAGPRALDQRLWPDGRGRHRGRPGDRGGRGARAPAVGAVALGSARPVAGGRGRGHRLLPQPPRARGGAQRRRRAAQRRADGGPERRLRGGRHPAAEQAAVPDGDRREPQRRHPGRPRLDGDPDGVPRTGQRHRPLGPGREQGDRDQAAEARRAEGHPRQRAALEPLQRRPGDGDQPRRRALGCRPAPR